VWAGASFALAYTYMEERKYNKAAAECIRIQQEYPQSIINNMLLGRVSAGTLTLASTAKGLGYEITPGETQVAADVMVHIERGDLSGSSFAFEVTDQEVRTENGIDIREIRGVKLYDVGPVTYPAYEATEADVRSLRERITSKPDAGGALLRLRLEESQS